MFTVKGVICTVGTRKTRSYSESQGDH